MGSARWDGASVTPTVSSDRGRVSVSGITTSGGVGLLNNASLGYPSDPVLQVQPASTGVDLTRYLQFTVTATGPWVPTGLSVRAARGGGSTPRGLVIRSSADGYASNVLDATSLPTARPTLTSYTGSPSTSDASTGDTTYRVYPYSPASTSTVELDDLTLAWDEPAPAAAPASVLDLRRLHLTLPTGPSGKPDQVDQPALATFMDSSYFYVDADGVVVLRAPEQGTTTSPASGSTRTELREHDEATYDNASWSMRDGVRRRLGATMRVDATTATDRQEAIVGQIHSSSDTPPLYLAVEQKPSTTPRLRIFAAGPGYANLLTGTGPSQVFSYEIVSPGDGTLELYGVLGAGDPLVSTPVVIPASTFGADTEGCYFKIGVYPKSKISDGGTGYVTTYLSDLRLPPPVAPARPFTLWDGASRVPLTLRGRWTGSALEPLTVKTVTPSSQPVAVGYGAGYGENYGG